MEQHERYMREALAEAYKARDEGNVGVGTVIVRQGEIIAKGRNLVSATHDPTAHAETLAIREAGPALGTDNLSDCVLYTTFQPCPMCCGAIMACGIRTVVIGARPIGSANIYGNYRMELLVEMAGQGGQVEIIDGILETESREVRY